MLVPIRRQREAAQQAVRDVAQWLGYPALRLDGHRTVLGTPHAWTAFAKVSDLPTLLLALRRLREQQSEQQSEWREEVPDAAF